MSVLPDVLGPNLKLVFCGTAAGKVSAEQRAYYANKRNRFWSELYRIGLTPRKLDPSEYRLLLDYGVGLTDLVKEHFGNDNELEDQHFDPSGFVAKIETYRPSMVAYTSKQAASRFFGKPTREIKYGLQEETIGCSRLFVLTSTSGQNGHWNSEPWDDLVKELKVLKRSSDMIARKEFDVENYVQRVRSGPCFICEILKSNPEYAHHVVIENETGIVFLNKYPTLYGYLLVAPKEHCTRVTADFTFKEYLDLQHLVYRCAEALRVEVPTERIYILSLGSNQGNAHVHWHVAPLPPNVPYEQQQFHALMGENGILEIPDEAMASLASRLRKRLEESRETYERLP